MITNKSVTVPGRNEQQYDGQDVELRVVGHVPTPQHALQETCEK